jgi:Fic family protein
MSCGRIREISVEIGASVFQPLDVPQQINECFDQILDTTNAIDDPYEQAFFVMVHLPYLQPFEDVNKRVSRLAANIPFIKNNLCPLSFIDLPERSYIDGLLGVYELNYIELLRDVFIWAYKRSCKRYSAVQQSLGEPEPFRLQYRKLIKQCISEIIQNQLNKETAIKYIKKVANEKIPLDSKNKFIEVVESELISLHEGNIARYKIKPSEYNQWLSKWN